MWMQKGDYEWLKKTKGVDEDVNVKQTRWQLNAKAEEWRRWNNRLHAR